MACLRNLALAPDGRRTAACWRCAVRLLSLAKAGEIDAVDMAGRIKGVMKGFGYAVAPDGVAMPEVDGILAQAWQAARPLPLPTRRR